MSPLSSDDLRAIREELNEGTSPVVWFTSSAVGVTEGRSGKVIALNEPAEGDFIQVRPASSKDVLSFSTAELTRVKPPRKKPAPEPAPAKNSRGRTEKPAAEAGKPGSRAASVPAAKPRTEATAKPADEPAQPGAAKAADKPRPSNQASSARSKQRQSKPATGGATVTLTADPDGQWTVEVSTPKKRVVKPTQVSVNAVQQAARMLHEDVSAAVEPVIEAAREQHRARVEALRAELEAAQAALEELGD
ncbi:DUF6319 family protein [Saccharopolyspora griseoalba]|uniref:DUF6319 family protein n=1 Tax=Saccharopolyspora griseoalba TaxID=1431848 RepID=A0ABW2LES7_9PSEU